MEQVLAFPRGFKATNMPTGRFAASRDLKLPAKVRDARQPCSIKDQPPPEDAIVTTKVLISAARAATSARVTLVS